VVIELASITVCHPCDDTREVKVVRIQRASEEGEGLRRVTARDTRGSRDFVVWLIDGEGKRVGGVHSGPWAHSFGCQESDGL
jgi:hypothetical protein